MSPHAARRLAWATLGVTTPLTLAALVASVPVAKGFDLFVLGLLAFPVVGAVVVQQQPKNAVGWVMLVVGVALALDGVLQIYADLALKRRPGSLPRPDIALALSAPMWVLLVAVPGTFLLLLFPDGRLPSAVWRRWAWLCGTVIALSFLAMLFAPGAFNDVGHPGVANPFGIDALEPLVAAVYGVIALIPVCITGCAVALGRRFRESRGPARQQLKWLALGGAATAATYSVAMVPSVALDDRWSAGAGTPAWLSVLQALALFSFVLVPISVAIAMFRHRLYDVDVVINRTLVYGALTALLGGAYLGLVLLFGFVLSPLTESSSLAIAGSTLAVAAVFRPARTRIQALVDRRFYRRRYDARRTVQRFGHRLRDEVELESLGRELRAAVGETVQPSHVSLWLRPSAGGPGT